MATVKSSKKSRVLSALESGKGVTRQSAEKRFGVQNLRAIIADLRNNDGYTNIVTDYTSTGAVKYTIA